MSDDSPSYNAVDLVNAYEAVEVDPNAVEDESSEAAEAALYDAEGGMNTANPVPALAPPPIVRPLRSTSLVSSASAVNNSGSSTPGSRHGRSGIVAVDMRSSTTSDPNLQSYEQPSDDNNGTHLSTNIPKRTSSHDPMLSPTMVKSTMAKGSNDDKRVKEDAILQMLCEYEGGFPMLLDRLKTTSSSYREVATFLKKRALLEEEYARGLVKLSSAYADAQPNDGRGGSFRENWVKALRAHENAGNTRLKFAGMINDGVDGITQILKETDRAKKTLKEAGTRFEKQLVDQEQALDRTPEQAKVKYEATSEEWERALVQHAQQQVSSTSAPQPDQAASSISAATFKNLFKTVRTPEQIAKLEEELRYKASLANDSYKMALKNANHARQEYYGYALPKVLKALLEVEAEVNTGVQYWLAKYAVYWEQAVAIEASQVLPPDGNGVRAAVDSIDHDADLDRFLQERLPDSIPVSDIAYVGYRMSTEAERATQAANARAVFGVDLLTSLRRDGRQIPLVLIKCAHLVEEQGIESQGIYRLSGTAARMRMLKQEFDRDPDAVDLSQPDWRDDVHTIASTLKMYFRELPEPLFPVTYHADLIRAAKDPDNAVQNLKAILSNLPRQIFETAKFLFKHLQAIQQLSDMNKMTATNLGICWGPTLLPAADPLADMNGDSVQVVEKLINNCDVVLV